MNVLQLSIHYPPNIGGVETHLDDLVKVLTKRGFKVTVLTYQPLVTTIWGKMYEKNNSLKVFRIPWLRGLFYKLVPYPFWEFIYLLPGLFFITPFILMSNKFDLIHAHGLVAGFVGVFWGKIFGNKVIISIHNIYHFPKKGFYSSFVKWIFVSADWCLGLSKQSVEEIKSLGISEKKVDFFTYWIDLKKFHPVASRESLKMKMKKKLGWGGEFIVLFVGRLIDEKGIRQLVQAAHIWNSAIDLVIVGTGPDEQWLSKQTNMSQNVHFLGKIDQEELSFFYNAADLLIVPSTHEEGFGRVILESLACGTPVVGARKGAIPEALDKSVGKIIDIDSQNIKEAVEYFYESRDQLQRLARNCRKFAERRYSEKNADTIIKAYKY